MMPKFEGVYVTALGYELGPVVISSAELEERLNLVHSLKRKYGASLTEVLRFGEEAARRLARFSEAEHFC